MSIVVIGLNHKSAPLDIREQLAFATSEVEAALHQLKASDPEAEFVLLSTCNRVELYCAAERAPGEIEDSLIAFLASFHRLRRDEFEPCLYVHENEDAVRHLLMVSAGLDSMIIGEAQILGQVKESYKQACAAHSTGKTLNRLFHCAFFTAKTVHTATSISNGRVSVAGVAVELALQLFADIVRAKVVVIGAGDTGELVVQQLLKRGCTDVTVVNRSYERGRDLAQRSGIKVKPWEQLGEQLGSANIVISSAATPTYLYSRQTFEPIFRKRKAGALLVIDVGVPRNFEPQINRIEDVYLYSVDELKAVAEQNLRLREEDLTKGLEIVYASAAGFMDWLSAKDIGPLIGRMKEEFRQISQKELERFFVGVRREASCRNVMEAAVNRVVNRLLHCVIHNVNTVAKEAGPTEAAKLVDAIVQQAREISHASDNGKDVTT
ncbi:MAG: glutamyl-tRNA reductase [Sedimentisphaerales bacterium]|nr:glutamyl-tRNA reductase [Sedimentisphaerales bacterium]